MQRLEQKALRKYGKNIDIIDVDIGSMNGAELQLYMGSRRRNRDERCSGCLFEFFKKGNKKWK